MGYCGYRVGLVFCAEKIIGLVPFDFERFEAYICRPAGRSALLEEPGRP